MGHFIIDAMKPGGALFAPGHIFTTHAIGWGEPQTLSADCSCGQAAIPVQEDDIRALIPPLKAFAEKYGKNALLHGTSVYGDWDTLARQCLGHIEAMGSTLEERVTDAMAQLRFASDGLQTELNSEAARTNRADAVPSAFTVAVEAKKLEVLIMAQELKDRVALPEPVPVTPESEAAYEDALEAQYPGWHARMEQREREAAEG